MTYPGGPSRGEAGLPDSYDATFVRHATADNTYCEDYGKELPLEVKLVVHPNNNGVIVVNYPGVAGDIDGYNGKYATMGSFMQQKIGAVIRTDNPYHQAFNYSNSVQDHLRSVISYTLENSQTVAGSRSEETRLYLMGFSAGASAVAAVASETANVEKILLMAPSGDAGEEAVRTGLGRFVGECHIVVGENDEMVGPHTGALFASMATSASVVRNVLIPNCDHQFRGELNGRIMSAAPGWAFLGENGPLPSAENGVFLYD